MATPIAGRSAIDRFIRVTGILPDAISPCIDDIVNSLRAEELIGFELKSQIINMKESDKKKASTLVIELERRLNNEKDPDDFLNKLSSILIKRGDRLLTQIAESLIYDSSIVEHVSAKEATSIIQPSMVSKRPGLRKRKSDVEDSSIVEHVSPKKATSIVQPPVVSKRTGLRKKKRNVKDQSESSVAKAMKIWPIEPDEAPDLWEANVVLQSHDSMDQQSSAPCGSQDDQQDDDTQGDIFSDPLLKELALALQVYSCDLNESGLDTQVTLNRIKDRIKKHIKKSLENGLSKNDVTKHLTDLTMNALIPMNINDWCYNELDEISKELDDKRASLIKDDSFSDEASFCELLPLVSKDVVYHASLCNLVLSNVSSQTTDDYLSQFGHTFDEMSLSVYGETKIFIAQQENIVYISFGSKKVRNESEQLKKELEELPLRYFCELLHQNKQLIITGFSFGGLLARLIVSKIWSLPYFGCHILTQNAACITFGLPDFYLTLLMEPEDLQQSSRSCHSFMFENDLCQHSMIQGLSHSKEKEKIGRFLSDLNGKAYIIQQKHDGLHVLISENLIQDLSVVALSVIKKFTMEMYHRGVLRGYLEKEPEFYRMPPRQKSKSSGVKSVVPIISKIEVHHHKHPDGNELAIVIKGDNLWFCDSIEITTDQFEVLKFPISAQNVTPKQICYNHMLDTEVFTMKQSDPQIPVKVYSKFIAKPINYDVPMTYTESDPISFRQSQLAKQTPSQIISLSFLSALLEQSPSVHSGRTTKRLNCIIKFLQEAAFIVPMESMVFSIANTTTPATALKLAQAVVSEHKTKSLPVSKLMVLGCNEAAMTLDILYDIGQFNQGHSQRAMYVRHLRQLHRRQEFSHFSSGEYKLLSEISLSTESRKLLRESDDIIKSFIDLTRNVVKAASACHSLSLICEKNIGESYPISKAVTHTTDVSALTPLSQVLQKARKRLTTLSIRHNEAKLGVAIVNCDMLKEVNKIIEEDLNPCITMLGGFMEQQIRVPLVNSNVLDTAKALRTAETSGAIGVWALFALDKKDIKNIASTRKNQTLVIQVAKFIEGVLDENAVERRKFDKSTTSYDAKLQFLLQAMNKTVTCSSNYISYSLERELVTICKEHKISTSTSVDHIVRNWDAQFKATALALVPHLYRPLLARWLIWALNIHQLREGLASYTTVGVIGLVNSGKSTLVNKVFRIKTIQGTTQSARTTVPFIYNLDSSLEGLSVIDFPGVDDRDDSIGGLAKLLVGLAQIVIFVCGYERFHTGSATEWMEIFKRDFASTPILVCLTHADRLYEDSCDDSMIPECPKEKIQGLKMKFDDELENIIGTTEKSHNCMVRLCSLTQTRHSPLNNKVGRQSMRKVGIFIPEDIEDWIKNALAQNIQQQDLADKFHTFLNST